MGDTLTKYENGVRIRLKKIRNRHRMTQQEMADQMGISLESYKRIEYGTSKAPTEALLTLIDNMNEDSDYVLRGRSRGIMKLVDSFFGATDQERAEFFMELSRVYRKHASEYSVDYMDSEGDVIETSRGKKRKKK